jgi:hypothetical protein
MPFKSEEQRRWMHANEPEMAARWEKEEKQNEEDESDKKRLGEKKMKVTKSQLKRMISEMMVDELGREAIEVVELSDVELLRAYYQGLTPQSDPEYVAALESALYERGLWENRHYKAKTLKEAAFSPMRSRAHPDFAKAIKGKTKRLREQTGKSVAVLEENLFNALDDWVQAVDEQMGYDTPTEKLKDEVMSFVNDYFKETAFAASQAEREEELAKQGFKNPSYG